MTEPDTSPSPTRNPDALPQHTTPTWEVELLISGVAVFAMLQLPGWLDDRFFALRPRLDANWVEMLLYLYMYLKGAALILAVTFTLHLMLRAHWIALVGMHSVFPEGLRPRKWRTGPIQRHIDAGQQLPPEQSIDRADNSATVVFALGVVLASRLLLICVLVIVGFGLGRLLALLTGVDISNAAILLGAAVVLLLPLTVARSIDRRHGDGLAEDGLPKRLLTGTLRLYSRFRVSRNSEVMGLLSSHVGERRMFLLTFLFFSSVLVIVMLGWRMQQAPQRLGSYALFPFSAHSVLTSAAYADQRDAERAPAIAYIQSAVIDGPYLRLTVPYVPIADGPAVLHDCARPASASQPSGSARDDALLGCLARLHAVSLDGQPLDAIHYAAGDDPHTQQPALIAMIDVRALAPGRHVLRVKQSPHPHPGRFDRDNRGAWVIPFWR